MVTSTEYLYQTIGFAKITILYTDSSHSLLKHYIIIALRGPYPSMYNCLGKYGVYTNIIEENFGQTYYLDNNFIVRGYFKWSTYNAQQQDLY